MFAMLHSHTPSAIGKDGAEGSVCKDLKICHVLLSIFKENLLLEKGPGCWQVRGVTILPAKCRITDIFWVGLFFFLVGQ